MNRVNLRHHNFMTVSNKVLSQTLKWFWELETFDQFFNNNGLTKREKLSIENFKEDVKLFSFDRSSQKVYNNLIF